jgi:hypothetical protein
MWLSITWESSFWLSVGHSLSREDSADKIKASLKSTTTNTGILMNLEISSWVRRRFLKFRNTTSSFIPIGSTLNPNSFRIEGEKSLSPSSMSSSQGLMRPPRILLKGIETRSSHKTTQSSAS